MEQTQGFWKLVLGGNHLIPLQNESGAMFIDANCGNGEYASELATQYPNVHVVGIGRDYSAPIVKPMNCTFIVENPFEGSAIASNSCRFIQSRDVSLSMREENWREYLTQLYRMLTDGGYIQVLEVDVWRQYLSGHEGGGYQLYTQTVFPALAMTKGVCVQGLDQKLVQWALEVGFTEIYPIKVQIYFGNWPGYQIPQNVTTASAILRGNQMNAMDSQLPLLSSLLMDSRAAYTLIAAAKGELYDSNVTGYQNVYVHCKRITLTSVASDLWQKSRLRPLLGRRATVLQLGHWRYKGHIYGRFIAKISRTTLTSMVGINSLLLDEGWMSMGIGKHETM